MMSIHRFGWLAVACALAGCNESETKSQASTQLQAPAPAIANEADICAADAKVAKDFINLYVQHLKANEVAAEPVDTYEWLKGNVLVDESVASAYATVDLVDGDPILDAQDFPDRFESAGCPSQGLVKLKSVNGMDLIVMAKVAMVAGVSKVVGVGSLNMSAEGNADAGGKFGDAHPHAGSKQSKIAGSDAACIVGSNGAAALGSAYNDGVYLCREAIDAPYYNEWYAVAVDGAIATYRIVADGKVPFEGRLSVRCEDESGIWSKVEGYEDSDPETTVPSAAIDNLLQIECRR